MIVYLAESFIEYQMFHTKVTDLDKFYVQYSLLPPHHPQKIVPR
jgi:hypothetical protein